MKNYVIKLTTKRFALISICLIFFAYLANTQSLNTIEQKANEDGVAEIFSEFSDEELQIIMQDTASKQTLMSYCEQLNWNEYPYYLPGTNFVFPYDEGKHIECYGEWWYASFHLTGSSGKKYGAFVAFFRSPTLRRLKVFSISDLDEQQNYTYSNILGTLIASSTHFDLTYIEGDLSPDRWYNKWENLQLVPFEYQLYADGISQEDSSFMEIDLDMESLKAPMKVGDDGLLYIGDSYTYYYSHTRVDVTGNITVGGVTENVTGLAWIDHQYGGDESDDYVHWEWFGITLDDLREIMVCDVWVNGIFQGSHSEGMNFFDENCNHELLPDYTITPEENSLWIDPITGFRYATQWQIQEESKNINLLLTAEYEDQLMRLPEDPLDLLPMPIAFWEGACTVNGTIEGIPVTGKAYAELTHFNGYPLYGIFEEDDRLPINWSPYLIVDDVTIPENIELIIDPGVEILFVGDYKFNVYGTLEAIGTEQDSIIFTHYYPDEDSTWGGLRFYNADPQCTLQYCTIEYGHATGLGTDSDGGGIYCESSSPFISHCTIKNNVADGLGGGIYCENNSNIILTNVKISENIASINGGGVYCKTSNPELIRCVIVNNAVNREDGIGGGIYCDVSSPILNNCAVSNNLADYGCGIACVATYPPPSPHSDVIAINTIIWDNECWVSPCAYEPVYLIGLASFTATYCDIEDGWPGEGNIDCDPQFDEDFYLTWLNYPIEDETKSCCIDAGDPSSPLDPDGTRADMGARPFNRLRMCQYLWRCRSDMNQNWASPLVQTMGVYDGESSVTQFLPVEDCIWFLMDMKLVDPPLVDYHGVIVGYNPATCDTIETIEIENSWRDNRGLAYNFGVIYIDTISGWMVSGPSFWYTVFTEDSLYRIDDSGNKIGAYDIDVDSITGLAFDSDNNHLWCITSGSPDMLYEYYVFDVNTDPVLIQSLPVPWDVPSDFSAAGLEYHEESNMLISVNKNTHTIERFCDLAPDTTGGVIWIDKCVMGFEYPPDPFGIALVKNTEEAFIAGNTPGGPFPLDVYSNSCSSFGITLDLNVFLEGPFNGIDMNNDVYIGGLLPLSQPYKGPPWNYAGTDSVILLTNANIIDWVLIELRDAPDAASATEATMIAQQAAFLLNDGSVVGLDGISMLKFYETINDSLFVVIWHRNHLGVITANALKNYFYDFTTGVSQAFGIDAQKEIAPGIWAMIASDGNADGLINNLDLDSIWVPQAGKAGYKPADFNMDTEVDNKDKDDVWVPNEGKGSQVPD